MTRTPPQHGERRCYLRGCRRPECVAANAAYCKRYRVDRYSNGPRRVPAQPYIKLAARYAAHGWSHFQMAELAGCSETVFFDLLNGKSARLNPKTAKQLDQMPADPIDVPGRSHVDPTGTIRRGRALYRIGHTVQDMSVEIGLHPEALGRILTRPTTAVLASTAQGMTVLYAKWRWTPGKHLGNRTRAANRGWHGPLAWDDIDDPNAQPDGGEPYKPIIKGSRDSMRRAEIAHLLSCGESVATIALRMQRDEKYISDLISQGLDTPTYEAAA